MEKVLDEQLVSTLEDLCVQTIVMNTNIIPRSCELYCQHYTAPLPLYLVRKLLQKGKYQFSPKQITFLEAACPDLLNSKEQDKAYWCKIVTRCKLVA
jgi:hypothetical protein